MASGLAFYLHLPETTNTLIMEDIEFSTYSIDDEVRSLKLDLYQPKQTQPGPLPVIMYIHSGGWEENNKKSCPGELMSSYGYAVICPTHRYSYEASFPAQIHDIKAAVRWVRAKAYIYDFDPDKIGVVGEASGGHLSALLGTSAGVEALEGIAAPEAPENLEASEAPENLEEVESVEALEEVESVEAPLAVDETYSEFSSAVQAVVNWSGPTDFAQIPRAFEGDLSPKEYKRLQDKPWAHLTRITTRLLGGPIPEQLEKVELANPINYISPDDPPFLIVHDEADKWIPISQSEILVDALRSWDIEVDFYREAAREHQRIGEPINPMVLGKTMSFFYEHLKYRYEPETTDTQNYLQAYEQLKSQQKLTPKSELEQ